MIQKKVNNLEKLLITPFELFSGNGVDNPLCLAGVFPDSSHFIGRKELMCILLVDKIAKKRLV